MPDLNDIFQKCIADIDVGKILELIDEKKKTGTVIIAGKPEFCGTFGVSASHPAFVDTLEIEQAELCLDELEGRNIHLVFLSYEVMGLRGYRLADGRTASSFISRIIASKATVSSYCAPVSNSIAEVARQEVPKAYSEYEGYFNKKVSYILLTGLNNGRKFAETVGSFCARVSPSDDIEIIAVVNGSTDASASHALARLASRFDLKLVYPKGNIGYGGGMNAGIDVAKGQYICLIPDDIEFMRDNPFHPIVSFLDKNPDAGVVGAYSGGFCFSLVDPENADGLEYPFWVMPVGNVAGPQECEWTDGQFVEVDYASALCFMFRRELGRYDPRYYPYGLEEVAFCLEAKKQGYKVFLTNGGLSHDFASSVTRKKWVKNEAINNVHLPYANASYQLLDSYAAQLRDPQDVLGVRLYSVAGQLVHPPNPPFTLEDMKGKVEVRKSL